MTTNPDDKTVDRLEQIRELYEILLNRFLKRRLRARKCEFTSAVNLQKHVMGRSSCLFAQYESVAHPAVLPGPDGTRVFSGWVYATKLQMMPTKFYSSFNKCSCPLVSFRKLSRVLVSLTGRSCFPFKRSTCSAIRLHSAAIALTRSGY